MRPGALASGVEKAQGPARDARGNGQFGGRELAAVARAGVEADAVLQDQGALEGRVAEDHQLVQARGLVQEEFADVEKRVGPVVLGLNAGRDAGVDKEIARLAVEKPQPTQEGQVPGRQEGEVAQAVHGLPAVAGQRRLHAPAAQGLEQRLVPGAGVFQQRALVVAQQKHGPGAARLQLQQPVDHPPRVRPAIHVVAQKNHGVRGRIKGQEVEQPGQALVPPMDVADGEQPVRHGSGVVHWGSVSFFRKKQNASGGQGG